MGRRIRIGVIGSSQGGEDTLRNAFEVGCLIAKNDAILVCGGLGGVMEFVAKGAKKENGLSIGILPGEDTKNANSYIDIPIATGIGEARNILVVRNSDVLIAIGDGAGTLTEIAFALKLNKSVIGLDTWQLSKPDSKISDIIPVKTPKEAVSKALEVISC